MYDNCDNLFYLPAIYIIKYNNNNNIITTPTLFSQSPSLSFNLRPGNVANRTPSSVFGVIVWW